jgi:hypothetical protein
MVAALQTDKLTLLSIRPLKELCASYPEFVISCILNFTGNVLAKLVTVGCYVSSLDFNERLSGVTLPSIGFIKNGNSSFENEDLSTVWHRIFPQGITL